VQGGVGQAFITPQTPLWQSPPQLQARDTSQREHRPGVPAHIALTIPPQSMSDSMSDESPFFTTS
jgi:hypothetical protein